MQWAQKQHGFTIVELLIVVVVIAILASITIVSYNGITQNARDVGLTSSLQQASSSLTATYLSTQAYPDTLTGISGGGGTTFQYTPNNNSPVKNFCVSATNGGVTKHIAGMDGTVNKTVVGPCPGHTGTQAPLIADCPTGYITVPGSSLFNTNSFCVMKYEAKNSSGTAVSVPAGSPWASITQPAAITAGAAACPNCHLMTENEWLTIAQNIIYVPSNWVGGTVGVGALYEGHADGSPSSALAASATDTDGYINTGQTTGDQRRTFTLSNGQVIWDFAGNVREQTQQTITTGQPGTPVYSWQDWDSTGVQNNYGLIPQAAPVYSHPSAGTWTSTQNIGRLYSDSAQTTLRIFLRGGGYTDSATNNAGIYSLILNATDTSTSSTSGFRVAR